MGKLIENVQDGDAAALEVIRLIQDKLSQLKGYTARQTFKMVIEKHIKVWKP